ncbi:uncharacterized protein B0H18DRAFT_1126250 [Fomitopsis serialis]|uniref:uncharacterized protein n=1 Tax=Fomitopsis serialis TaxID=139415 RepID=UPI0020080BF9|nr:uncharacterized protein B0H18DRAFT_1126250 [Neoantrodia serialis]KAH9913441.1 hypothetical protein B0H18DRAFT_1126250 [Neoantrodia serialis]
MPIWPASAVSLVPPSAVSLVPPSAVSLTLPSAVSHAPSLAPPAISSAPLADSPTLSTESLTPSAISPAMPLAPSAILPASSAVSPASSAISPTPHVSKQVPFINPLKTRPKTAIPVAFTSPGAARPSSSGATAMKIKAPASTGSSKPKPTADKKKYYVKPRANSCTARNLYMQDLFAHNPGAQLTKAEFDMKFAALSRSETKMYAQKSAALRAQNKAGKSVEPASKAMEATPSGVQSDPEDEEMQVLEEPTTHLQDSLAGPSA